MALSPFLKQLLGAYRAAPSADNSQPCHIDWCPPRLIIRYDTERVSGLTFPAQSQATLLSAGAVVENISECCELANVGVEVVYFPVKEDSGVFAEITLDEYDQEILPELKLRALFRHTNRFAYKKTVVAQDIIDVVSAFEEGNAKITVLQNKRDISAISEQVKIASEIRFQTKEVHEWLERSLRFTPDQVKSGDGLDVATLDLPPGGGAFLRFISKWSRMHQLNRIGAYKVLAGIDSAPVKKAAAVVAITAPDSERGALDAGRVLCRTWGYLNAQGVACHPYYVISDQLERLAQGNVPEHLVAQAEGVRKNCRQLLDLSDGGTLTMLLRIGYPVRNAPHSQRLALEQVFTDLSGR